MLSTLACRTEYLTEVKRILEDASYTGQAFAEGIVNISVGVEVEVFKRHELHTFEVLPKSWIV